MEYYQPVDYTRISSTYGGRASPGGIGSTNHRGIDLAAPLGTGVFAPIGGEVLRAGVNGGYGNYVEIKGADGNTHLFGHLNSINVSKGDVIGAGGLLGTVGSTGTSTGNHLHYGVKNAAGDFINPKAILDKAKKKVAGAIDRAKGAAAGAAKGFAVAGPPGAVVGAVSGALGGGESWLDQFKAWLAGSGFFVRLAMVLVGLLLIGGAIVWIGRSQVTSAITKTVKG